MEETGGITDYSMAAQKACAEFGDLMAAFSAAFENDNKIDLHEKYRIFTEGSELIRAITEFLEAVKRA